MKFKNTILIIIFLFIQIIGLISVNYYSNIPDLKLGIITDDPNSLLNAVFMICYILFFTGLIFILKKYFKSNNFLYIFEFLAIFFGMLVIYDIFLPYFSAFLVSLILIYIKLILNKEYFKKISIWYNNFLLAIAIAGAGSIIGLSLGIIPVIFFLVALSIYDIIAVFYTKHMITLADMFSKKKIALLFNIPYKNKFLKLGGGDILLPLVVSSSLFYILSSKYSLIISLIPIISIWVASLLGLFITFYILEKTKVKILPALPIQSFLMIISIIFTNIFLL